LMQRAIIAIPSGSMPVYDPAGLRRATPEMAVSAATSALTSTSNLSPGSQSTVRRYVCGSIEYRMSNGPFGAGMDSRPKGAGAAIPAIRQVNARLMQAERQLNEPAGLPRRPWYRHLLYAPGFYTGYAVKTMPGVREAIEQKEYGEAETEIGRVAKALEREAMLLDEASAQLETIRCRGPLAPEEVGAICILRNEARRLPLFIDHYKRLGVDRFFMVDNQSEDETRELLLAEPSADVFVAHASFAEGSGGLYWANGLAQAYCTGNWVVRPDADELMVYDGMETKSLRDLGDWLWSQGQDRIFAMMLDVYPSGSIGSDQLPIADMLREDCWYDSEGYSLEENYGGWLITGGPRHRVFNQGQAVAYSHWISKYPFFRMGTDTAIVSHHWIWPMDWRANPPQRITYIDEAELVASLPDVVSTFEAAVAAEDFEAAAILIGESIGLVHAVRPAADIVAEMAAEASRILHR